MAARDMYNGAQPLLVSQNQQGAKMTIKGGAQSGGVRWSWTTSTSADMLSAAATLVPTCLYAGDTLRTLIAPSLHPYARHS